LSRLVNCEKTVGEDASGPREEDDCERAHRGRKYPRDVLRRLHRLCPIAVVDSDSAPRLWQAVIRMDDARRPSMTTMTTMSIRINARLDESRSRKLELISRATCLSTSDILKQAIDVYVVPSPRRQLPPQGFCDLIR
jgi:hypothetical protein